MDNIQVQWSEEDQEFVATTADFPSLSWLDADPQSAESGLRELVAEVTRDMESTGEIAPA